MALPKQIQKQVKEANEMAEAVRKAMTVEAVAPEQAPSANEPSSVVAPEGTSSAPGAAPIAAADSSSVGASPSPERDSAGPAATPSPEPWEQRYRVLQGKYNAEVPRMQQELNAATGQITALQGQIETLLERQQSAPAPEPAASDEVQYLRPQDREEYGNEMVDFVSRAAKEAHGRQISAMEQRIAELTAQVQAAQQAADNVRQRQVTSEASALDQYLNQHAPGWVDLNNDPQFLTWSNQIEPFSGATRLNLLRAAYSQGDGPRVAAIFNAFSQEHASPPNDSGVTASPPPAAPAPQAAPAQRVSMDTLVTPAPSSGVGQPAPSDTEAAPKGRIWTQQEIAQHYRDATRGKYRGRPEEYNAIEQDIHLATLEGRIR